MAAASRKRGCLPLRYPKEHGKTSRGVLPTWTQQATCPMTTAATNGRRVFRGRTLYLGAIGFAISIYAFRLHEPHPSRRFFGLRLHRHHQLRHKFWLRNTARFLGLPLGAWGMAYFVLVVLVSVTTNPKVSLQQETLWRLVVCGAGFLGTLALSYISYGILKAACPVCISTHIVIIACFVLALWQFFDVRKKCALVE